MVLLCDVNWVLSLTAMRGVGREMELCVSCSCFAAVGVPINKSSISCSREHPSPNQHSNREVIVAAESFNSLSLWLWKGLGSKGQHRAHQQPPRVLHEPGPLS